MSCNGNRSGMAWKYSGYTRMARTAPPPRCWKYQPGGRISLHEHVGFEHILVLSGSQVDENGRLETGSLMVHKPGTSHSIVSEEGCIVLAVYQKRVTFAVQEP